MAYSELIKNFDNIRGYMRDFFLYGFKTREEYDRKSARSYDNERRRIQSYLGHLISFRQTPSGKTPLFPWRAGASPTIRCIRRSKPKASPTRILHCIFCC